jgi:hypothetical protein
VSTATAKFLSWKPETEYLEGLAEYREMSTRKMNFFFDWVLGDKRWLLLYLCLNGKLISIFVKGSHPMANSIR